VDDLPRPDRSIRKIIGIALAVVAPLALLSTVRAGEIYKFVDARGVVHYTDRKVNDEYELIMRDGKFLKPGREPQIRIYRGGLDRYGYAGSRAPANRDRFKPLIDRVARENRIHPALLHAVVRAESSYDPGAISRKGAVGLMQLMPETARRYGVYDRWDPHSNLAGGARYLRDLIDLFGNDLRLALAAYNAGENAVRKYGNQVPPYQETRDYVRKVISLFRESLARS
jgi:soluble lytic murein transglycosylase-like protein